AVAPYIVVAIIGPMVVVAERLAPSRDAWRPTLKDFQTDGLFLVIVQMALPLVLVWSATLATLWISQRLGLTLDVLPADLPVLAQLALKVIAGDFLRYWLHRAAHTWTPLWRLHEVHHHPDKLYTTNVFRFHPCEKMLQFLCDTLPFIFLGIGAEAV